MHNLSRIGDMGSYLLDSIYLPCCKEKLVVRDCIFGYYCNKCLENFTFSWCDMELYNESHNFRSHNSEIKRCEKVLN